MTEKRGNCYVCSGENIIIPTIMSVKVLLKGHPTRASENDLH